MSRSGVRRRWVRLDGVSPSRGKRHKVRCAVSLPPARRSHRPGGASSASPPLTARSARATLFLALKDPAEGRWPYYTRTYSAGALFIRGEKPQELARFPRLQPGNGNISRA